MTQPEVSQIDSGTHTLILQAGSPQFSPVELFDYFTDPDLLQRWWAPEAGVDERVGGSYRLSWPAMNWRLTGQYTSFKRGERLAFSWKWEHEPHLWHLVWCENAI